MPDNVYIISDFSSDDRILFKTELGLFESEDLGENWYYYSKKRLGLKRGLSVSTQAIFQDLHGEKWLMVGNDIGAIYLS